MSGGTRTDVVALAPDRERLVAVGLVAYFVVLLLAPLAVPPVLAADSPVTYPRAVLQVVGVVLVAYLAGIAALLR